MAHIDFVKELMESLPVREYSTREITDMCVKYYTDNRIRLDGRIHSYTFKLLAKLEKRGIVKKVRVGYDSDRHTSVAYWMLTEGTE